MPFHRYEGWPPENASTTVPRLTETEARAYVHGWELVEERSATGVHRDYSIRQYYNPETGEHRFVGGAFKSWS